MSTATKASIEAKRQEALARRKRNTVIEISDDSSSDDERPTKRAHTQPCLGTTIIPAEPASFSMCEAAACPKCTYLNGPTDTVCAM